MHILLYIFLGLLLFDSLVVCYIYFRKERFIAQGWIVPEPPEEELNYLMALKLPKYSKTAKCNMTLGFLTNYVN